MDDKNFLFGTFGEWRNINLDLPIIKAKEIHDFLSLFELALMAGFFCYIAKQKGFNLGYYDFGKSELSKAYNEDEWEILIYLLALDLDNFIPSEPSLPREPLLSSSRSLKEFAEDLLRNSNYIAFEYSYSEVSSESNMLSDGQILYKSHFEIPIIPRLIFSFKIFTFDVFFCLPELFEQDIDYNEIIITNLPFYLKRNAFYRYYLKTIEDPSIKITREAVKKIITKVEEELKDLKEEENIKNKFIEISKDTKKLCGLPAALFVIHPKSIGQENYQSVKKKFEEQYGFQLFFSPEELLLQLTNGKNIPGILEEWRNIRDNAIAYLAELKLELKPFIVAVINHAKLEEMKKTLYEEVPKMIQESKFKDAIARIGILCEELFFIIYERQPDQTFNDALAFYKEKIEKEYSKNLFHDLLYIKNMRNLAVHQNNRFFSRIEAIEVWLRVQVFYNLFMQKAFHKISRL